jgi:hypothetical protein
MAMSGRLRAYLALEREMLELDETGDSAADELRSAMDPLWYGLTDDERAWLDARVIGPSRAAPVRGLGVVVDLPPSRLVRQPGIAA